MEEVVITGMGCVSALGNTPELLWNNLLEGKSGLATIDRFDVTNYSLGASSTLCMLLSRLLRMPVFLPKTKIRPVLA